MLVYQLVECKKFLEGVSNYNGVDFAYAVFKNKQLIDNKLSEVEFIKYVTPEVVEYEKKRIELCEKYCKKDQNGNPIIEDELYEIEEQDKFKEDMQDLFIKYKTYVDERQQQIDVFNKKMNEPIDFEFYKIKKDQIPDNFNASDLEKIFFMIE